MVAVEFDEFGAGRADEIHAELFADLMADLELDTAYGHYVDAAPAEALATVNLMSLLGLHRALRGALVGHFAAVEVTSPPPPAASPRPCGAPAPDRRPYGSIPSTSRPTRCTSRSYDTMSSGASWRANRAWRPT